ncbi:MAG: helix-turn-helix domain-containing protein [Spirochaetota bacterium]
MNISLEEAIFYFKELGFTEYEAKVYLSLLNQHPASAYAISQVSGVPHSRVYDITRRLIKKGLVGMASENPQKFSPLSPNELIVKLKNDNERFTGGLKVNLDRLAFSSDFDPVWNITDRKEALNITVNLISSARLSVYIGLWDEELSELKKILNDAHKRGSRLFFLIYGKTNPGFGTIYYHQTEALAGVEELGRTIDCVVDSSACISGSLGGVKPCQIVWTRNQGLVKSIEEYIIHDFYLAEIQLQFGDKLYEVFGKNLETLRKRYGR